MSMPNAYHQDRYQTLIALGLCSKCGKADSRAHATTCEACGASQRETQRRLRAARKAASLIREAA